MVLLRIEQPHVANDPEVAHSGGCHRVPMNAIIFVVTKTGNASVHDRRGHADAIPPCECIGSLHIKRVEIDPSTDGALVGRIWLVAQEPAVTAEPGPALRKVSRRAATKGRLIPCLVQVDFTGMETYAKKT